MPRLDNSDELVRSFYAKGQVETDRPIDLCDWCACAWLDAELFVEHPSYDDSNCACAECGRPLQEVRDGWTEKETEVAV